MKIETQRLIIRDVASSDEPSFADMALDGSLKDVGFDADCKKWLEGWMVEAKALADKDDPTAGYLAYTVQLKHPEIVIGSVGCSYYEDLEKVGITYFIGANYRNQGYALEAVKAYIRHFFRHYPIHELIATIREENIPSWKVIEKAGFHLLERKMYQDLNDEREKMYRFYLMEG